MPPGWLQTQNKGEIVTQVIKIRLSTSNAYLVKGERPILVDTGTEEGVPAILKAIAQAGLSPRDIALIVLTHGHGDHSGGAEKLKAATGAPIALHRLDLEIAQSGQNGVLRPSRLSSRFWKPLVAHPFSPFTPDIVLEGGERLAQWGVKASVVHLPGHTAGHCALRLDNGEAIVGDVLMGGYMGGMLRSGFPRVHYFYRDAAQLRKSIETVLTWNERTLYVGHGGPLSMAAARARFGQISVSPAATLA